MSRKRWSVQKKKPDANHARAHSIAVDRIRFALLKTGRVQLWPNPTGFDARARRDYGIGLGGADLVGLLKSGLGRFVGFEVKTGAGVLSDDQRRWHASVKASGGFACAVHDEAEALDALDRAFAFDVETIGYEPDGSRAPEIVWRYFE